MKNTILAIAFFCSYAAHAQTETKPPVAPAVVKPAVTTVATPATTPTPVVSTAKSDNIRPEDFLPALGTYNTATNAAVNITVDATNVGIVWVEGLPQGKFKALLRQSPATYKIPVQKSGSGKTIPEGTLFYNPETKEARILFGTFNDTNPAAVFEGKAKSRVITITKVETAVQ